jgi:ABC-type dipeptide/oligopeptide/nickel transport system permease component
MLRYLSARFLSFIPTLLAITFLTFLLGYYGPGDPVRIILGQDWRNEEEYQRIRASLGLDRPFIVQYGDFLGDLLRGDFGYSYMQKTRSINTLIVEKLPVSMQLGLVATIILFATGIPLGILAAYHQNRLLDYIIVSATVLLHAVPPYALAPILLTVFVLKLGVLPVGHGWKGLMNPGLIIPIFLLVIGPMAILVRQVRSGMLEVLSMDFVRTARAKGLPEKVVLLNHALRNALIPALTTLGLIFSNMLIGSIFVEEIFGLPGFGNLLVGAVRARDFPLLIATTTVAAIVIMLINLLTDVLYGFLDPRIRYQ